MSLAHRGGPLGTRPFGEFLDCGDERLYVESSPKRVRVHVAAATVADTLHPRLLHQPGAPASWWFSRTDVREDLLEDAGDREQHPLLGRTQLLDLRTGERLLRGFAHHHPDVAALDGLLHLDCHAADRVYEEDELVAAEPIDPFHPVDVRDASRHVRISLGGVTLAESHTPRMVFETPRAPAFTSLPRSCVPTYSSALEAAAQGRAPAKPQRQPRMRPMLNGAGHMWETWQAAGGHAKSDVLREVPPMYLTGRIGAWLQPLPDPVRGGVAMALSMTAPLAAVLGGRAWVRRLRR